jgi:hypothetical protein
VAELRWLWVLGVGVAKTRLFLEVGVVETVDTAAWWCCGVTCGVALLAAVDGDDPGLWGGLPLDGCCCCCWPWFLALFCCFCIFCTLGFTFLMTGGEVTMFAIQDNNKEDGVWSSFVL